MPAPWRRQNSSAGWFSASARWKGGGRGQSPSARVASGTSARECDAEGGRRDAEGKAGGVRGGEVADGREAEAGGYAEKLLGRSAVGIHGDLLERGYSKDYSDAMADAMAQLQGRSYIS
ncbi:hypothetical protein THAOC_08414 [Thalassiosira oceanica]|uniref:Uncharacterized protein n=1 Tax=Thalassiosira oceanica TaxID=159749 RepID=K0TI97_THAOC|nr:hypothetical protein THAOC_08414 [Thalassiosira oceanica]|eukprot:EJK70242.1 hypothetical protein THAOC_08414 [Thalassiosira oceanica]